MDDPRFKHVATDPRFKVSMSVSMYLTYVYLVDVRHKSIHCKFCLLHEECFHCVV